MDKKTLSDLEAMLLKAEKDFRPNTQTGEPVRLYAAIKKYVSAMPDDGAELKRRAEIVRSSCSFGSHYSHCRAKCLAFEQSEIASQLGVDHAITRLRLLPEHPFFLSALRSAIDFLQGLNDAALHSPKLETNRQERDQFLSECKAWQTECERIYRAGYVAHSDGCFYLRGFYLFKTYVNRIADAPSSDKDHIDFVLSWIRRPMDAEVFRVMREAVGSLPTVPPPSDLSGFSAVLSRKEENRVLMIVDLLKKDQMLSNYKVRHEKREKVYKRLAQLKRDEGRKAKEGKGINLYLVAEQRYKSNH